MKKHIYTVWVICVIGLTFLGCGDDDPIDTVTVPSEAGAQAVKVNGLPVANLIATSPVDGEWADLRRPVTLTFDVLPLMVKVSGTVAAIVKNEAF